MKEQRQSDLSVNAGKSNGYNHAKTSNSMYDGQTTHQPKSSNNEESSDSSSDKKPIEESVIKIQSVVRMFLARNKYYEMQNEAYENRLREQNLT